MGAFLEKPKTEKTTSSGEGYGIRYAVSAMQGWRMEMEDAHVCTTEFKLKNWSFFGVFDGHAGAKVSMYCAEHLLSSILECLESEKNEENIDEYSVEKVKEAVHKGFLHMDEKIHKDPVWANGDDHSGTTAIVVMISPTHIIWANCGDSRGIMCKANGLAFATTDHKPYVVSEKNRIEKAGGTVMMQRVNGSLAVSRALGDFDYKRNLSLDPVDQLVSPEPDMTVLERDNSQDEFLLLACDGVYDVMANEEVLTYVRHRLELTSDLSQICNDLIDTCLHKNSRDNMSVILVVFPSAPQVSQEAIDQEERLQEEAKEKIVVRLKEIVDSAYDPLEVEENYVIQQLTLDLPSNYDVVGKRPFVAEKLQELTKVKFGEMDNDLENDSFAGGQSDASMAPAELTVYTKSGDMVIRGVMEHEPEDEFHSYDGRLMNLNYGIEEDDETITSMMTTSINEEKSIEENMEESSKDLQEDLTTPDQQTASVAT